MGDVELLLVRMDHFRDRAKYVSVLREWLVELQIVNGRVITMGADLQLLFVAASEAQNSKLLDFYGTRDIDTNSRGELCIDKFIDVLGRKKVQASGSCKGFLEMNVLSPTLLQKVLVHEWQAEQEWLDAALATTRTKAFLKWKEAAKAARKERRKREGQEKQHEREAKRLKREQEVAQKALEDAAAAAKDEEAAGEQEEEVAVGEQEEEVAVGEVEVEAEAEEPTPETKAEEVSKQQTMKAASLPQKQQPKQPQQSSGQKKNKNKHKKRRTKQAVSGRQ